MHQKIEDTSLEQSIQTDVCIVGSGAAGIPLALELEKANKSVLLIESGSFEYDPEIQAMNKGENVGQTYFPLQSCRLRFFGGTTGHWTGQCATLDDIDFQEREWVPNSGWPISKTDLDPYYERAHEYLDLQEYNYGPEFWETKLDKNILPFDGKIIGSKIWQKSSPTRFGTKYKDQIVNSKTIRLLTGANLTYINLNEAGRAIKSFEIKSIKGKTHYIFAKTFVMACGALQNARYLLNSNNVINTGVGNKSGNVGKFFMEHPHVNTGELLLLSQYNTSIYHDHSLNSKAFAMLTTNQDMQRNLKLQNFSTRIVPLNDPSEEINHNIEPEDYLKQWENLDNRSEKFKKLKNIFGEDQIDILLDRYANKYKGAIYKEGDKMETIRFTLNTRSEQSPNPDSTVQLAKSKDVLGVPHIKLNWNLTEDDKNSILQSSLLLGRELGANGFGRLKLNEWLRDKELEWPKYLAGGWHHMGVTRMSISSETGVVDKNCQAHEVDNLFIAGSGVFATSGIANPTLTIVALSIRLAEHIKGLKSTTISNDV